MEDYAKSQLKTIEETIVDLRKDIEDYGWRLMFNSTRMSLKRIISSAEEVLSVVDKLQTYEYWEHYRPF